tara:strand:- start:1540 stop:2061 length:522 start_codon:yes stop_codon:yes gene_type:complete
MTLQELQEMIKEEFTHFVNEQPVPGGMPPAGGPGLPPPAPGAPGIDVAPGDIDAMEPPMGGPDGAEAQLQKIFGMLKSYFEGGEEGMEEPDMDIDAADMDDMGDDMPDMQDVEVDGEEEETVDEAYGERNGGNATSTSGKYGGAYGATGTDTGNAQLHEGLKSRMQKLANIRK